MLKSLLYIVLIFFILTSTNSALGEKNAIFEGTKNTEVNIKKAKLLENYVYSLNRNLRELKDKYNIKNDIDIDKIEEELSIMIVSLRKIQSESIEKQVSEKITSEVIKRLKLLTPKLKEVLKEKKNKFELNNVKIKEKYSKISNLLSNKIEKIVISLYNPIKDKKHYSLKDSKVIRHLKNLLKENSKLKDFRNDKYNNEKEIKKELLAILRNIQKEISGLKNILN